MSLTCCVHAIAPAGGPLLGTCLDASARNTTDYWLPPYEKAVRERERRAALAEGEAEAREVAMSVNNRRTPSGNFFSTVNPSLRKETDESASRKTTATMRDELDTLNHEITLRREETLRREAEVLQSLGKQTAVADKTWVMQAGEQQKMAKLIGTKRTPTGGFFLEQ